LRHDANLAAAVAQRQQRLAAAKARGNTLEPENRHVIFSDMTDGTFSPRRQRRQRVEQLERIAGAPAHGPDRELIEFRVDGVKHVLEVAREPIFDGRRRRAFWLCGRCRQHRQHLYLPTLHCRECINDGAGLTYELRTLGNDDRRERSRLFPSVRKRRRLARRPLAERAAEAALAELIKARFFLKPIDLQRVTEAITGAIEYMDGLARLRLDREERGPEGRMGPPPAPEPAADMPSGEVRGGNGSPAPGS